MSYTLSPQLTEFVQARLASGRYSNEEQVVAAALQLLAERDSALEGIEEGLRDVQEGRVRTLVAADAELYARYQIPLNDE